MRHLHWQTSHDTIARDGMQITTTMTEAANKRQVHRGRVQASKYSLVVIDNSHRDNQHQMIGWEELFGQNSEDDIVNGTE